MDIKVISLPKFPTLQYAQLQSRWGFEIKLESPRQDVLMWDCHVFMNLFKECISFF